MKEKVSFASPKHHIITAIISLRKESSRRDKWFEFNILLKQFKSILLYQY